MKNLKYNPTLPCGINEPAWRICLNKENKFSVKYMEFNSEEMIINALSSFGSIYFTSEEDAIARAKELNGEN